MQEKIRNIIDGLANCHYIADQELATALALVEMLERPLLIEGEAGVGKTSIAAALACVKGTELIRIQCYEGIDSASALYEWNYPRQLMHIKLNEQQCETTSESDIYSERFLLERPLLKAIRQEKSPVLLIDEVDRSDEAFEAFLLEILSEFTVTIPELGKIRARSIPIVVLTSNGTRELSDALRRRCLFHFANYPSYAREIQILSSYLPEIDETLLKQVARFVQTVREWDIAKRPGIAETLDWARALNGFDVDSLVSSESAVTSTLSCLLKTPDDQQIGFQQIQDHGMDSLLARSA